MAVLRRVGGAWRAIGGAPAGGGGGATTPGGSVSGTTTVVVVSGPGFTYDTTKPSASNTGPAAAGYAVSSTINGDVILSAGQVLEDTLINGFVTMGSGSTLRGCKVVGRGAGLTISQQGSHAALVAVPGGLAQMPTVEFCDIGQSVNLGYWMNATNLAGPCLVRRNNIHDGTDLIKASGSQAAGEVAGNYLHGYSYHNDDGDQASSTPAYVSHNDIVQFGNGINGFNFHGNYIELEYSPATSVGVPSTSSNVGWGNGVTVSGSSIAQGLFIDSNWFTGGISGTPSVGVFQANGYPTAQGSISMGWVGNNRVAYDQYDFGGGSRYQIRYATAYAAMDGLTTNFFDGSLRGVTAAGLSGKFFALGTSGTSGIRRP